MPTVKTFTVVPRLPEPLKRLADVGRNLWWTWDPEAIDLFFRIDRDLWDETQHNPQLMLGQMSQIRLEKLASDDSFLAHLNRVVERLDAYMSGARWHEKLGPAPDSFKVAYFSAEFGLHEAVRIYSGGLGILAGDHLKAASDLGLPLIAVGLLYREGYFSQYLNSDGWQQETYPRNDFHNMPIEPVIGPDGEPLVIEVPYPKATVKAQVWKCQVGRVPLYLLDCDRDDNAPEDRVITDKLYGGDHETRVRQEIMLGMGGTIALHAMGIHPTCYHMNEGHSAFMALQRIKELVQSGEYTFPQAVELVKAGSFFTTHTPVPAGNDMFDPALIATYFQKYCHEVGISMNDLLALGRQNPADTHETFCMTVLALKLSAGANGVSKLHGEVARDMWQKTWPGVPVTEVPITAITNGIHTRTWISRDLAALYDRYLGPGWVNSPDDHSIWERVSHIPDTELWRTHARRRERLVEFARRRLYQQLQHRGATASELRTCYEMLDPEVLTIGFARRFATYKRATLLLRDLQRIRDIITDAKEPVQFIIAGKAHPADTAGKQLIRDLHHFANDPVVRDRVVFIEDYDMNVARYMVQGVDCWLNTPRRPMEASGTSGMKASANGALNISIPDGWWCEAEDLGDNGWSIGHGEDYASTEEQDDVESQAMYEILEREVAPIFYQRGTDGLPREWIRRMKEAIRTIVPFFNTSRMVQNYTERYYIPLSIRREKFIAGDAAKALALADWKQRIADAWPQVRVVSFDAEERSGLPVSTEVSVHAEVQLGSLKPGDVLVEVYHGALDVRGKVPAGKCAEMTPGEDLGNGTWRYRGKFRCEATGKRGFSVRVVPNHADLREKHETALITWG